LENKFNQNPTLKEEYQKFIHEYLNLNNMELYADITADVPLEGHHLLPHPAVLNPTCSTTKLRVVFDGSAQFDYLYILVRFCLVRFAFLCDAV
jgi:hypothetical protein